MKKLAYFIVFLFLSATAMAEQRLIVMPFHIYSDSVNPELSKNEAEFKFRIRNPEFQNPPFEILLRTSVNGVWKEMAIDSAGCFSYKVEPGEYEFKFYANGNFLEISSQKVKIGSQHEINVALTFVETYTNPYQPYRNRPIQIDKPVIYFHTDEEREFEIGVQPKEGFSFVYPEMNGTWKGTAETNGTVTIADQTYPYLFWESKQQYVFQSEGNGFKVEQKDAIAFLTKKLSELGLDLKEQTDFITYWGPKLAANETSFVQFSIDESCDAFATMTCSPKPDLIRRVYIQIAPWDAEFEPYLREVTFGPVTKSSWYIVEWGGFEFKFNNL